MAVIPMMLLIPSFRQWETAHFSTGGVHAGQGGRGVAVILLASRFVILSSSRKSSG